MAAAGDLSDVSERDSGAQDSSNDADSEASESECGPQTSSLSHGHTSTTLSTSTLTSSITPASTSSPTSSSCMRRGGSVEQLVSAVSKVNLGFSTGDCSTHYSPEEQGEAQTRENLHQHHQGAFQALSHSYIPSSKECSIQSCLHQFTSVELLMGNNKLLCENCTERRQKHLRKSSSAGESISFLSCVQSDIEFIYLQSGTLCRYIINKLFIIFALRIEKKVEKMYTSARKQMLISSLPPVIILHLKRFHQVKYTLFVSLSTSNLVMCEFIDEQLWPVSHFCSTFKAGMNFRKVNRHVDFPLILDMAPFCSAACKVFSYIRTIAKYIYFLACLSVFLRIIL